MTGTEIAVRDPQAGTLALSGDQVEWSPVQQAALAHIGIADAPPADQQVFLHVCQRIRLDPFARQVYMIGRRERGKGGEPDTVKWTIQTGIDGFRLIAERHEQYAGTLDPEWCGQDGVWREAWVDRQPPVAARVKVLRHDRAHPITLPVRFTEFAATFGDGNLQGQWRTKPAHMIAKVAEAAALRKAFPQELSGLYTDDEMDGAASTGRGPAGRASSTPGVTAAELTGAPTVVDAEPEPEPPRAAKKTSAPGKTRTSAAGAATPAAADPEASSGPPLPGEDEPPAEDQAPGPADTDPATKPQNAHMHALFREAEVADRDERLKLTGLLLDRQLDTSKGLTVTDARAIIDALVRLKDSGHKDGLAGAVNDLLNLAALREAEEQGDGQDRSDDTRRTES
jgi:phage recombination protein Bet